MADNASNGVLEVITRRVRTLLGDPRKDQNFILGHLEIVCEEMAEKFQSYGLRFDTRVVVLAAIPANTTDLRGQQAVGGPLFDLMVPESLEWKLAGQPELNWQPVANAEVLTDTNVGPGTDQSTVESALSWAESWEWRGGTIFTSPASVALDFRVRGQFMPQFVTNDAVNPLRAAINVLSFGTARSVVVTAGGPASALAKDFGARMVNSLGDFQSNQTKAQQLKPLRFGGRRASRGTGNFTPRFE